MEPPEKPEEPTGDDGPATGASGEAAGPALPAPREAADTAAPAHHNEGGAAAEPPSREAVPAEQARGGAEQARGGAEQARGGAEPAPVPAPLTTEGFVFARLGWPARIVIALSVGLATVLGLWHIAMGFLYVAPANTLSKEYASVIRDGYSNPEFEQNWKLFAPNPLQSDIAVEVRAEFAVENGGVRTTDWINLTAMDIDAIRYNLLPSHTAHNTLRRAWDTYSNTLDEDGRPVGARGERATVYLHRIALLRLSTIMDIEPLQRLQIRSAVTPLATPPWDDRSVNTETVHDEQDWRTVLPPDRPRGALAPDGERPPPQPAPEADAEDAEDADGDAAAERDEDADGTAAAGNGAHRAPTTGSDQGTSGTEAREGES